MVLQWKSSTKQRTQRTGATNGVLQRASSVNSPCWYALFTFLAIIYVPLPTSFPSCFQTTYFCWWFCLLKTGTVRWKDRNCEEISKSFGDVVSGPKKSACTPGHFSRGDAGNEEKAKSCAKPYVASRVHESLTGALKNNCLLPYCECFKYFSLPAFLW